MTTKELSQMSDSELVERYEDLKEAFGLTDSPIKLEKLTNESVALILEMSARANA